MRFEVWAPAATSMSLWLEGGQIAMNRVGGSPGGWWATEVEGVSPGDRYGYSVDGGPVRPDPRSPDLPGGVHEAGAVVDHAAHRWSDAAWSGLRWPGVLYELHIGTFTPAGTFAAAADRLPYLRELGVDAVEVMPVASFEGGRGWGYDGVGLYAPHAAYGGPAGLKALVDAAHREGIGVILDVVYNHLGPSGNYLPEFGPYFSERHHTNWGAAVNLDGPDSDDVRRFFIDNALMWLRDYHIDGLRLDAVHALVDDSARHFLEQLSEEVTGLSAQLDRPLWLIAESDRNDPRYVRRPAAGGYGMDAAWADEWHHAWHAAFTGERDGYYEDFGTLRHLAKALRQAWVYDGIYSPHRRRTHGRRPDGLGGETFVVSTQNHDQIGNRAAGERSSGLLNFSLLEVAAGLLLTSPFVPMLFMGEEWGATTPWQYFTDFADTALGRAVTEGRRSEFAHFGWDPASVPDPQSEDTFRRSKLVWEETEKEPHRSLLEWYRALIALRRQHPGLSAGDPASVLVDVDEEVGAITVSRPGYLVAAVIGDRPASREVGPCRLLLQSSGGAQIKDGRLRLAPESLAVMARDPVDAGGERGGRRSASPPPTESIPGRWSRETQL